MFSKFFIYRPVFAMVISIVIVIAGSIAIPILPIESMPDITPPTVKVTARFPGANAQVVEESIAQPIEQEVNGVENMLYMSSKSSSTGDYDLTVSFEVGTDPDMAQVLTQNRASKAEPLLPEDVKKQGLTVQKQSTQLVLTVALDSPDNRFDDLYLSNYATTQIKDVLGRVQGVGLVTIFGAKDFGMRVWLDPARLRARGITAEEVIGALREQNTQVAAGKVGEPPNKAGLTFEYTISTQGRLTDVQQFEDIVLKRGEGNSLLRLKDVARVELGAQAYSWYGELNGNPAIVLGIYQLPGSNALAVADGVREVIDELSENFPEGLRATVPYDSTAYVQASIKEVVTSLVIAVILVIGTVFLFLQDVRTTLIPAITIPVSLIGTFAAMLALGLSINNLTLFGLVLVIGIVVDDAIVVVEATMRNIDEEGLAPKEATAKAMGEVGGAVIASTLVLLAVFIPTTMMPGLIGRLYRQFALTISVATVISSINALTLSPALCGILLRKSKVRTDFFFGGFNKIFDRATKGYMGIVHTTVRRAGLMFLVWIGLLVATFFSLTALPGGFVPNEDQGYFFVNVQLPNAATLERTGEVMDEVNAILTETPGVTDVIMIAGYSLLESVQGPNYGMVIAALEDWEDRQTPELRLEGIMASVSARFSGIKEAIVFPFPPPPIAGLGSAGGFSMELQDRGGIGLGVLETIANDIVAAGNQSPVLTRMNQNFRANVPQLFVDIDREKAKTLGIPLSNLFLTLQANLGATYVNDFNLFGRTWRVMVQADQQYRERPQDILALEVRTSEGLMVPLSTLVTVSETAGPQAINRFNMFRSASVTGTAMPGFSDGEATDEVERITQQLSPAAMGYDWSGVTQQQKASGNLAPFIFGLAIVFVFLFLAAQYESWATPLSVMMSVPVAILGAALMTMARSLDMNVYTQIGLVLLIGLAAKNAIMIVEFSKQRREEGKSIEEASIEAGHLRFRPILMTAVSFLLGVIPLVVASGAGMNSRVSLGTAVFGGMLVATSVGLMLVPVMDVLVQRMASRGGKKQTAPAPPPADDPVAS